MKNKKKKYILKGIVISLLLPIVVAAGGNYFLEDNDLSAPKVLTAEQVRNKMENEIISPDQIVTAGPLPEGELKLRIQYARHDQWLAVAGLDFKIDGLPSGTVTDLNGELHLTFPKGCKNEMGLDAELKNDRFNITNGSNTYKIQLSLECGKSYDVRFLESSENGQAISIYKTFYSAHTKLAQAIGLDFWDWPVTAVWPADGDYYDSYTVYITNGHHWDVVGHELGHAIYDMGRLGAWGYGPHKIDECYTGELALSEGWASYFSSWVHIDLNNPDAKFQYMVPRRAPIHVETVPADVCVSTTNEWRVMSYLWDVVDLNSDGENADESFAQLWQAMHSRMPQNIEEATQLFYNNKIDRSKIQTAWKNNFL